MGYFLRLENPMTKKRLTDLDWYLAVLGLLQGKSGMAEICTRYGISQTSFLCLSGGIDERD